MGAERLRQKFWDTDGTMDYREFLRMNAPMGTEGHAFGDSKPRHPPLIRVPPEARGERVRTSSSYGRTRNH